MQCEIKVHQASSSSQNVPAVPLEIVDRILKEACEFPLCRADRQALRACALVCKSWLPLVRGLLYHSLTVENSRPYVSRTPGTLGPATLFRRSHLLMFTRSLTIHIIDEFATTLSLITEEGIMSHPECVRILDFLSLLTHTAGLRHLCLSVFWSHKDRCSFEPSILDWLSSLGLPMEILDLKYSRPFASPLVYDLVRVWPTIKALRVDTNCGKPVPQRPNLRLRELRLPITSMASVIEWFLPPPPPLDRSNLHILELYEIPEDGRAILSPHGPNVSSLTLTRQPVFALADLFTNLEELVIKGPFWSRPLPTLPKTLKHLRLQVHAFMSDSVIPAIAEGLSGLPNLRMLSIEEALTPDKYYPTLREACKRHRVKILVNPVDSSVMGTAHPYLAEIDRFPRQATFSEFFNIESNNHQPAVSAVWGVSPV
ncbi:hypothetical protein BJV78DRAFT_626326 [Lactifluus subvellereus]|nr:hypothetical protein BJV78DRAFT_626326 [Lactifluus subvellereus]